MIPFASFLKVKTARTLVLKCTRASTRKHTFSVLFWHLSDVYVQRRPITAPGNPRRRTK